MIFKNNAGAELEKCDPLSLHSTTIFVEPYYGRKFVKENLNNKEDGILARYLNNFFKYFYNYSFSAWVLVELLGWVFGTIVLQLKFCNAEYHFVLQLQKYHLR